MTQLQILHMVDEESYITLTDSFTTGHKDEWILNSGYTYYMWPNHKLFSNLEELEGGVT